MIGIKILKVEFTFYFLLQVEGEGEEGEEREKYFIGPNIREVGVEKEWREQER